MLSIQRHYRLKHLRHMAQNKEFFDWVKLKGGHISPSIDLFGVLPHGSRGIAATADIPRGQVLILMPMKACIHALAEEKVYPRSHATLIMTLFLPYLELIRIRRRSPALCS